MIRRHSLWSTSVFCMKNNYRIITQDNRHLWVAVRKMLRFLNAESINGLNTGIRAHNGRLILQIISYHKGCPPNWRLVLSTHWEKCARLLALDNYHCVIGFEPIEYNNHHWRRSGGSNVGRQMGSQGAGKLVVELVGRRCNKHTYHLVYCYGRD